MRLGRAGGLICTVSGTLSVLVRKAGVTGQFLLSCSHVIANCGQFSLPFNQLPNDRKVVQQPIVMPCDASMNRVGLLTATFSKIIPQSDGDTTSDLALALLDPEVAALSSTVQPATGNSIRSFAAEDPSHWSPGTRTQLLGAVNSGARGAILRVNGATPEFISYPTVGQVRFTGLVRYSTSCDAGDSGGAVIDEQNRLLGIHVAGGQGVGLFMPVGNFMTQNGLTMA